MSTNAFSNMVGVTTEETVSNAFSLNSNLSTRNIGMLVERVRGIANQVKLVTSQKEDNLIYGGHNSNMYSSYVVESLFKNNGGYPTNLYECRIVGVGCVAASGEITNPGATTFTSLTVQVDDGDSNEQVDTATLVSPHAGNVFTINLQTLNNAYTINYTAPSGSLATILAGIKSAYDTAIDGDDSAPSSTINTEAGTILFDASAVGNTFNLVVSWDMGSYAGVNLFDVTAAYQGNPDVGTWGNNLKVKAYPKDDPNGSPLGNIFQVFYNNTLV